MQAGPAAPLAAKDSCGAALPLGFHHLTAAMKALGTIWILVLMVLINADVPGRRRSMRSGSVNARNGNNAP